MKFYSIEDDDVPSEINPEKDFFIGANKHITLTIHNGETIRVRDIVVVGKLTIKSTNMENTAVKGSLVANDLFAPGSLQASNINLNCRNFYQPKNTKKFKEELLDLIIDWFRCQREHAERMQLRSILV